MDAAVITVLVLGVVGTTDDGFVVVADVGLHYRNGDTACRNECKARVGFACHNRTVAASMTESLSSGPFSAWQVLRMYFAFMSSLLTAHHSRP